MELKRILLAIALALLPASGQAQQTQSTINPNVPVVGTQVEQSGPLFRSNWQAAINDINVLFGRTPGVGTNILSFYSGSGDAAPSIVTSIGSGGKSVFFPPGNYPINSCMAVPSNTTLWAVPGTVTWTVSASIPMSSCPTIGGSKAFLYNSGYAGAGNTNIVFDGITLVGPGSAATTQIAKIAFVLVTNFQFVNGGVNNFGNGSFYTQGIGAFNLTGYFLIQNNNFSANSGDGFACSSCANGIISGNIAQSNLDYGVAIISSSNISVIGNVISSNTNSGIGLDASTDSTVSGNTTTGNAYGVRLIDVTGPNSRISVTGNNSKNDMVAGISSEVTNGVTICGNEIYSAATSFGIQVLGTQNNAICGNAVTVPNSGSVAGIIVYATAGLTSQNNNVTGNSVNGGNWGIREVNIGGTLGLNQILGNMVSGAGTAYATVSTPVYVPSANILQAAQLAFTGGAYQAGSIYQSPTLGSALACNAGSTFDCVILNASGNVAMGLVAGGKCVEFGSNTAPSCINGELAFNRVGVSGTGPGSGFGKLALVCGTGGGTAKLVIYAGTSGTPVTIADNIGSGVSGC